MSFATFLERASAIENRFRARVVPVLRAVADPPGGYGFLYIDGDTGKLATRRSDGTVTKYGTGGGAPSGSAGGDLGGTYPNPTVTQARGLRETSGPTTLTAGAIADGQVAQRVGSTLVGLTLGVGATLDVDSRRFLDNYEHCEWYQNGLSASCRAAVGATFAVTGTLSVVYGTYRRYQKMLATNTLIATASGFASTTTIGCSTDYDFTARFYIRTESTLTNGRYFYGIGQNAPANSDTLQNDTIAFRYTDGVDTKFVLCSKATGAQETSAGIGSTVTADTDYVLEVRYDQAAGTLKGRVSTDNGVTWSSEVTNTTLPTTGTNLGPIIRSLNVAGAVRAAASIWSGVQVLNYLDPA